MRAALALMLAACTPSAPTQLLVEVDSDLFAPEQIDRITLRAVAPDGRVQSASAALGPGELPLPRVLTMVHGEGELGPFLLTIVAERGGEPVLERRASVSFVPGETRVLRVMLPRACIGEDCNDDPERTCAPGGCRSVEVGEHELEPWDGRAPPLDAGSGCAAERCNGVDDDCDGDADEGFDTREDEEHCGGCGIRCASEHARAACVEGVCVIQSCEPPWADCDGNPTNGCETDTTRADRHCGACGTACRPPTPECCDGECGRC